MAGKTLVQLGLAREGVLVLGMRRPDGNYLGAPSGGSRIGAGDTLVIHGPLGRLQELDARCGGPEGDQAHQDAAAEYAHYLAEVHEEDAAIAPSA